MWNYNYNNELYHYGVPGMKWGVRKRRNNVSSIAPVKKKSQPGWQRKKTEMEKQWIDDYGFNPHRPNGTKPKRLAKVTKGEQIVNKILEGIRNTGIIYANKED